MAHAVLYPVRDKNRLNLFFKYRLPIPDFRYFSRAKTSCSSAFRPAESRCNYPLFYRFLEVIPFLLHGAPGPRPKHSTFPDFCKSLKTFRIMSLLTPGQDFSRSESPIHLPSLGVRRPPHHPVKTKKPPS